MIMGTAEDYAAATTAAAGSDLTARNNRATVALAAARDNAIDKAFAITAVAISMSECNANWIIPRRGEMPYDLACYPSRICVGIEPYARSDVGGSGAWYPSVVAEPVTLTEIQNLGGAREEGGLQLITGDFTKPNTDTAATLFEFALVNRDPALLKAFSIGPTQMWMAQTPMSIQYVQAVGKEGVYPAGQPATFPQTWEDIFDFYTSRDTPNVFKHLDYIKSGTLPGEDPTNKDAAISWLKRVQTGNAAGIAESYYNAFFGPNLKKAGAIWQSLESGEIPAWLAKPAPYTGSIASNP